MKNTSKVQFVRLFIIALVAVIGFSMVACGDGGGGGGSGGGGSGGGGSGGGGGGGGGGPVTITAISITAPVTGKTPVTSITENVQYYGMVSWSDNDNNWFVRDDGNRHSFAAAKQYIASITLYPKPGYYFSRSGTYDEVFEVYGNFFTVTGALYHMEDWGDDNTRINIIAYFPSTAGTKENPAVIDISAIQGVSAPATGKTPVKTITENPQYSGTVTWSPNHSTFAASTPYTATIKLTPKTGYTLQGVDTDFFYLYETLSLSGYDYEKTSLSDDSGVITVVFPPTASAGGDTKISIAAIQGVTVPAIGGKPVTSITENAQYSGTITWSPNHSTFAASTPYTATIKLTPKTGYTLQGVTANFFTVAGATSVSNSANSGVITAVFRQVSEVLTVTNTMEWNNACNYIATNGNGTSYSTPKAYIIMVKGDILVPVVTQTFGSVSNVAVTLQGDGKLFSNSQGNMIKTYNQTLVIDSANLILQGPTNNNVPLIYCIGKLEMKNGTIIGNINISSSSSDDIMSIYGGVVYVSNEFIMSGGTIKGGNNIYSSGLYLPNLFSQGGGVYVNGNFTMSGGTISGSNSCSAQGNNGYHVYNQGGGVYVNGNFTMSGGTISGSSCSNSGGINSFSYSHGGGVYARGAFIKTGGIIYGNDASDTNKNTVSGFNAYGHAVYLYNNTGGYYRNSTLGESDNLYSTSPLPVNSGETLNGWTKQQ